MTLDFAISMIDKELKRFNRRLSLLNHSAQSLREMGEGDDHPIMREQRVVRSRRDALIDVQRMLKSSEYKASKDY